MNPTSVGDAAPEVFHPRLYLGISSWSSDDWVGPFYPPGTPPGEYLAYLMFERVRALPC